MKTRSGIVEDIQRIILQDSMNDIKQLKPTVCRMTDVTQLETHVQKVLDQIMLNNMAHGNRAFLYAAKMCMIYNFHNHKYVLK